MNRSSRALAIGVVVAAAVGWFLRTPEAPPLPPPKAHAEILPPVVQPPFPPTLDAAEARAWRERLIRSDDALAEVVGVSAGAALPAMCQQHVA